MSRFEKFLALSGLVYSVMYIPAFVFFSEGRTAVFVPFLVLAMASIIMVAGLAFKDLYQRPFPTAKGKLKWLVFMLLFGPMIVVYLFRHAFKPRVQPMQRLM